MVQFNFADYTPDYFHKVNDFWINNDLGGSFRGDNAEIIESTLSFGGHLVIMIGVNDNVIGTCWMTNDKRRTYIHHFGIDKEYRGKGLARKLMEHCMQIAIKDGYQVKLEVHKTNEAAKNLYKSFGFNYLGDYEVLIKRNLHSEE
jgi:ribosomal protein S18 acetylase RimI-like enzyme